jgi:hypothetical protein
MGRWSEPNAAHAPAGELEQIARRNPSNGDRSGERNMNTWIKRYAVGFLLALCVLSGIDAHKRPVEGVRFGSVIMMAAAWPMTLAIVVGGTVGGVVRDGV